MHSIASSIWNEIAETQTLKSDWAKQMFVLDEVEMPIALESERQQLMGKGCDNSVVLAFHSMAPLLWEKEAIAAYVEDHPNLYEALPNVETIDEALFYAVGDYRLTEDQQSNLAHLLESGGSGVSEPKSMKQKVANLEGMATNSKVPKQVQLKAKIHAKQGRGLIAKRADQAIEKRAELEAQKERMATPIEDTVRTLSDIEKENAIEEDSMPDYLLEKYHRAYVPPMNPWLGWVLRWWVLFLAAILGQLLVYGIWAFFFANDHYLIENIWDFLFKNVKIIEIAFFLSLISLVAPNIAIRYDEPWHPWSSKYTGGIEYRLLGSFSIIAITLIAAYLLFASLHTVPSGMSSLIKAGFFQPFILTALQVWINLYYSKKAIPKYFTENWKDYEHPRT